jgi:ABC-type proline/glycine betaine transport system permease subunit
VTPSRRFWPRRATRCGWRVPPALIGLGRFGFLILEGLDRFLTTPLVVGAVLSVALAIGADLGLAGLTALLRPWARRRG